MKGPDPMRWGETWRTHHAPEALEALDREILAEIHRAIDPRGLEVLELGCGTGRLSLGLAEAGARRVTLVDFSQAALALARPQLAGHAAEFLEADLLALEGEAVADLVFSSGVAEHFDGEERQRVIRRHLELSRRWALLVVPARPHPNTFRQRRARTRMRYGWQHPFSRAEIARRIAAVPGFRLVHCRRFHPLYGIGALALLGTAGVSRVERAWNRMLRAGDGFFHHLRLGVLAARLLRPLEERCGGLLVAVAERTKPIAAPRGAPRAGRGDAR